MNYCVKLARQVSNSRDEVQVERRVFSLRLYRGISAVHFHMTNPKVARWKREVSISRFSCLMKFLICCDCVMYKYLRSSRYFDLTIGPLTSYRFSNGATQHFISILCYYYRNNVRRAFSMCYRERCTKAFQRRGIKGKKYDFFETLSPICT